MTSLAPSCAHAAVAEALELPPLSKHLLPYIDHHITSQNRIFVIDTDTHYLRKHHGRQTITTEAGLTSVRLPRRLPPSNHICDSSECAPRNTIRLTEQSSHSQEAISHHSKRYWPRALAKPVHRRKGRPHNTADLQPRPRTRRIGSDWRCLHSTLPRSLQHRQQNRSIQPHRRPRAQRPKMP